MCEILDYSLISHKLHSLELHVVHSPSVHQSITSHITVTVKVTVDSTLEDRTGHGTRFKTQDREHCMKFVSCTEKCKDNICEVPGYH